MLKLIFFVTGYRFHDFARTKLRLPFPGTGLDSKEIRDKSRASTAVAGVFLALLVALLATLVGSEDFIKSLQPFSAQFVIAGIVGALLPYLVLREERKISAARGEAKGWSQRMRKSEVEEKEKRDQLRTLHNGLLLVLLALYIVFFLRWHWAVSPARTLALAGLFLILGALVLLVWSVEFYDTAGGWQRLNDTEYHFHVASLASNCYLLGLPLTLVGSSLLLCLKHPRTGYWLSVVLLVFLTLMFKTERGIYDIPTLTQNDIRARAYRIYGERQRQGRLGSELDDWLEAERELLR